MNKNASMLHYAMYAPYCSDVTTVRKYLDQGVLAKMLADKEEKLLSGEGSYQDSCRAGPGYNFILLGACAMSLGCTIPEEFKDTMRKVFKCVGLMEDAIAQVDRALNGSKPYKDGKPWDCRSLDLKETMERNLIRGEVNSAGIVPCNTPGLGTMYYNPPKRSTMGLEELKLKFAETRYGSEACSQRGATGEKDGDALLECARCHTRKYCSKDCQISHWKAAHMKFCKEASKLRGENAKGENAKGENAKGENAKGENAKGENAKGENAKGENAKGENAKAENMKPQPKVEISSTEETLLKGLMEATIEDVD